MRNRIRELREEMQISQIDLAKVFNITSATISQYELGKRFPDQETLEKLADYFKVSIDYLLVRSDVRSSEGKSGIKTKSYHIRDLSGLPEEAIKQIDDYIEFIKFKYIPDGNLKGK